MVILPVIGITSSAAEKTLTSLNKAYVNAVAAAGGTPVVLPNKPGLENSCIPVCDGFLFSGGGDVQGFYFGQKSHEKSSFVSEERDEFEIALARLVFRARKPVFGICRGMQLLNIALGGDLLQHVEGHVQGDTRSSAAHYVETAEGTRLRAWLGSPVKVNSMHHQVVNKLAPGFIVSARSRHGNADGYIEGMEYQDLGAWFAYCVQWHPEAMLESPEHIAMLELFKPLVAACKGGKI